MKSKLIVLSLVAVLLTGAVAPTFAGRAHAAAPAAKIVQTLPAHPVAKIVQTLPAHPVAKGRIAFVIHAGIAFFLFHHIYKLYKQGYYHGFHPIRWTKAAVELVLAVHETRKAVDSANRSNSPTLHLLVKPLNAIGSAINRLSTDLKAGHVNPSDFTHINSSISSFEGQSTKAGYAITESSTGY